MCEKCGILMACKECSKKCLEIDQELTKDFHDSKKPKSVIVHTQDEFLEAVKNLPKGSTISFEEK